MIATIQEPKFLSKSAMDDGSVPNSKSMDVIKSPPEIPHVEFNQLPLSLLLRNLTVYTVKEIDQFMRTNVYTSQDPAIKKLEFLKMIIFLRNQFLRIYVLVKWCKTIKKNNFSTMINLLNWFRGTNICVNNCLLSLKDMQNSMAGAKLPNPDLITAVEVLILGRSNLPTHDHILSGENHDNLKIPERLILKRLKDLNILLSMKISIMDIPTEFSNYKIKDGRIIITVESEFEIHLSTIDQRSPLFFVDCKLLFNDNLPLNISKMEKVINEILFKSIRPLDAVYQFIHRYVLTLQIYMIHIELVDLEVNGKYSGGNLVHHYDSKKNMIFLKYWLQSKIGSTCKASIGVDKETKSLILKWHKPGLKDDISTKYRNILGNLESILDEITFNHSQLIRSELLETGVFQEDEDNSDSLLFQVPTTCVSTAPIQLKINHVSGVLYFKNPTSFLLSYIRKINQSSSSDELIYILEKLRLEKIVHILKNMFEKTAWICNEVVKLDTPILYKLHKDQKRIQTCDLFIRLNEWPSSWFLILSVVSSHSVCIVEKRIGKIVSIKGSWELKYLDENNITSSKLESMTYQKIIYLKNTILSKIINHVLIDSLNEMNIGKKSCSREVLHSLPDYLGDSSNEDISVIVLELQSFLEESKTLNTILESSMLMKIDYRLHEIKVFGKFKKDTQMIKCKCDELLIHFIPDDSLTFYMIEKFDKFDNTTKYLKKFKQKLMQLVVLTDVIDTLHNNFLSEYFQIVKLKPNEISFKYLKDSNDSQDCTIEIFNNEEEIKNLHIKLSESNPQHIIQPFLDQTVHHHDFIFKYLQFTLNLFSAITKILQSTSEFTNIALHLHNLSTYHLVYFNHSLGGGIALSIELKNSPHDDTRFFVHFSPNEHISTTKPMYPLAHKVSNTWFLLNHDSPKNLPGVIRLGTGVACSAESIEALLEDIHSILTQ